MPSPNKSKKKKAAVTPRSLIRYDDMPCMGFSPAKRREADLQRYIAHAQYIVRRGK